MATEVGVELTKTLLDGKAFQKVLDHARKIDPWMLVIGRIGVHSDENETGLGSNAENLLRSCPCDLLLTTRLEYPELDVKAEESIRWTPEAEERFERVPEQVRGIARTALYRLAIEQGHSVISSDVLDEAMDRYMPKYTARETEALAGQVALQIARSRPTFICRKCGVTSAEPDPVRCGVCGSESFEQITEEMLERIAEMEGGLEVETTYDGRKLKWTADARLALKTIEDLYRRRRAKARIEKKARMSKLPTVTFEFARAQIEDETGEPVTIEAREQAAEANGNGSAVSEATSDERKLIARDADRVPLLSTYEWTADATSRILRVPAGFMRDRTQERVELVAREKHVSQIGIRTVEEGIELGPRADGADDRGLRDRQGRRNPGERGRRGRDEGRDGGRQVPFSALAEAGASEAQVEAAKDAKAGTYLNEVGLMSALDQKRKAGEPEPEFRFSGVGRRHGPLEPLGANMGRPKDIGVVDLMLEIPAGGARHGHGGGAPPQP